MGELDLLESLSQELRRGTIVLSALCLLKKPQYGYSLVQELAEHGIPVEAGTLYPLLRRLEKQGLLRSEWEVGGSKPRKYYLRTPLGEEICRELQRQWKDLAGRLEQLAAIDSD